MSITDCVIDPDGNPPVQPSELIEPTERISWPDPTPEMLDSPVFDAIWNVIKSWDVAVPGAYYGYCGATGNHVRAIMDAITPVMLPLILRPMAPMVKAILSHHLKQPADLTGIDQSDGKVHKGKIVLEP